MEKGQKGHGQDIVRSHSHKDLRGLDPIVVRQCLGQHPSLGIRIQPKTVCIKSLQGLPHARSRWIRIFIGVQFNHIRLIRLLPRHIGDHSSHLVSPVTHIFSFLLSKSTCPTFPAKAPRTILLKRRAEAFLFLLSILGLGVKTPKLLVTRNLSHQPCPFQVEGQKRIRKGKSSSLPASISRVSIILEMGL